MCRQAAIAAFRRQNRKESRYRSRSCIVSPPEVPIQIFVAAALPMRHGGGASGRMRGSYARLDTRIAVDRRSVSGAPRHHSLPYQRDQLPDRSQ
jgi:hypothetical protein